MQTTYRLRLMLAALLLLMLPVIPAAGQTPPAQEAPPSFFIASGSTADEDIARLRAALAKSAGVDHLDIVAHPGGVTLRIKGTPMGSLLSARAKTVGYALRPMPLNTYHASGLAATADTKTLREALSKIDGVEQVDITGAIRSAEVRVLGDVKAVPLAAVARSAGFELRRTGYFVAAGSAEPSDVMRLRTTLRKVSGVSRLEMQEVAGGTLLGIQGVMEDEALVAAAKASGYELRAMVDPAGGPFSVTGIVNGGDEDKLRKALQGVAGIGYFQIEDTSDGTQLTLPISIAKPEAVIAAAKAAGFELRPVYPFFEASSSTGVERNTPPASNDRILEDLTKVGDLAPDFTLIAKDGQSKIGLSDYRGKKPVILIFGSYT